MNTDNNQATWIWDTDQELIPAIIQDQNSKDVLMLGYMNKDSFTKTLETGLITFYSRSKKRLWTKGETSGNFLKLKSWNIDCDQDTLLFMAEPKGPTCHNGTKTCFDNNKAENLSPTLSTSNSSLEFLLKLESIINDRFNDLSDEKSYVTSLIKKGSDHIIQKVGEEAVEVVISAKNSDLNDFKNETADLLFHLLVLLRSKNVSLNDITEVLLTRNK